jgi:hypothetical protein
MHRFLCGAAAFLAVTWASTSAHAKPKLALDGEGAIALDPSRVSSGLGAGLRLGYELDAILLSITPEVGGDFHAFGGDLAPTALRGFAGGRLALGVGVRPNVFGHVGLASISNRNDGTRSSSTWDAGLGLDFTLLPLLDLGVHAAYVAVPGTVEGPTNRWVAAGLHVAFAF